jgi:hypothetical protein
LPRKFLHFVLMPSFLPELVSQVLYACVDW